MDTQRALFFAAALQLLSRTASEDMSSLGCTINSIAPDIDRYNIPDPCTLSFKETAIDMYALQLVPPDSPEDYIPIRTTGNGNCFYNAVSISLCGHEKMATELRVRTGIALYQMTSLFLDENSVTVENFIKEQILLYAPFANHEYNIGSRNLSKETIEMVLKHEIQDTFKDKCWSGMWQLQGLSTALNISILSMYPQYNPQIRHLFNKVVTPLLPYEETLYMIPILWSGTLSSQGFQANHFVPLIHRTRLQNITQLINRSDPDRLVDRVDSSEAPKSSILESHGNATKAEKPKNTLVAKQNIHMYQCSEYLPKHYCNVCQKLICAIKAPVLSISEEGKTFICSFCKRHLSKEAQSPLDANNIQPGLTPPVLKILSHMELNLVSLIHPYMNLLKLPVGGQYGQRGQSINIPILIQDIHSTLPVQEITLAQPFMIITTPHKTRKEHTINYRNVYNALEWLIENNVHYKHVEISTPTHQSDTGAFSSANTIQDHACKSVTPENLSTDSPKEFNNEHLQCSTEDNKNEVIQSSTKDKINTDQSNVSQDNFKNEMSSTIHRTNGQIYQTQKDTNNGDIQFSTTDTKEGTSRSSTSLTCSQHNTSYVHKVSTSTTNMKYHPNDSTKEHTSSLGHDIKQGHIISPHYETINEDIRSSLKDNMKDSTTSCFLNATKTEELNLSQNHMTEVQNIPTPDISHEDVQHVSLIPTDYIVPKKHKESNTFPKHDMPYFKTKPINIFEHSSAEEMAFPNLFPYGINGFKSVKPSITFQQYITCRMLNSDTRWAKNIPYLFWALNVHEQQCLQSSISVALRLNPQSKNQLQAEHILQKQYTQYVSEDFKFMKKIKGTASYWRDQLHNLLAKINILGPPTFFLSLSSNDSNWNELYQFIDPALTEEEVKKLSTTVKSQMLRENPIKSALYFSKRWETFLSKVIRGPNQPLGEILDYFARIEFQNRGSPHVHAFLWVKDAPNMETKAGRAEGIPFIDKYIKAQLPQDNDPLHLLGKVFTDT